MKKLLLLLLFISGIVNAQIVNIPDVKFNSFLIAQGVDTNTDGEIQESEALAVTQLDICNCNWPSINNIPLGITSLEGISSFTNLETLVIYGEPVLTLNLSALINLKELTVSYCPVLSDLNVQGCIALERIYPNENIQLKTLDVSGLAALKYIDAVSSVELGGLTSVNVKGCMALESILVSGHKLTTLDVSGLTSLVDLDASLNQLTTLNVTGCTALNRIVAMDNLLTTFDLTSCGCSKINTEVWDPVILGLANNKLMTLFLKTGTPEEVYIDNNLDLAYICIDENLIEIYREQLIQQNLNINVVINSYCTFSLGGDYNIIKGKATFDADNNGCDASDINNRVLRMDLTDGTYQNITFTNTTGDYTFNVQEPDLVLTPSIENPDYFTISPASVTLNFPENNHSTQIQDFCVTANGVHNDLEIVILPIGAARPGFNAKYKLVYKNKGNQTLSGEVLFYFDDLVTDFISASIEPNNINGDYLTWSYLNLKPFETRTIDLVFNINSPMETPAVNDGDLLSYAATISPVENDSTVLDNGFPLRQRVVNSLDPNDITCLQGDVVTPDKIGEYLHYTINFENIGTASAINIVVKDIIDTEKFDVSTFQMIDASHEVVTKITNNKVEFIHEGIELGAKEKGYVVFKIKTLKTLVENDTVLQNADIYFDYNFPIATNDAETTFQILSNTDFAIDSSIRIFPNPANEFVNINANESIKSIQLYDFQGRIIKTSLINENQTKFDISNYSNGIYFIKVQTNEGIKVEKLQKN